MKSFSPRQQWLALGLAAVLLASYAGVRLLRPSEAGAPLPASAPQAGAASLAVEAPAQPLTESPQPSSRRAAAVHVSFPIDVNRATAAELDSVPGIGPATAAHIMEKRRELGGFKSLDDLKQVKGIKDKRLAKFAPYLRVSGRR